MPLQDARKRVEKLRQIRGESSITMLHVSAGWVMEASQEDGG